MMRTIRMICVLAFVLAPVLAHGAGSGAPTTTAPARTAASAKPAAKPATKASSKGASKKSRMTAQKATKSTTASSEPTRAAGPRRLEDIHIEGEVPVPQVLFITARDQRRFLGSHHDLYLRTSRELGESTPLPARVVLTPGATPVTAPSAATKDAR
jgi:hypothetical protein